MKAEFEKISENLKKELAVFEEKRVLEFKNKLISYLETLLETQQTVSCIYIYIAPLSILTMWGNIVILIFIFDNDVEDKYSCTLTLLD